MAERLVSEAASNCNSPFDEEKAMEKVERAYGTYEPSSSGGKPTHDELARRSLRQHPGYSFGQAEWKRHGREV
jgi:hypothetical protein